jgi:hypothetical protein
MKNKKSSFSTEFTDNHREPQRKNHVNLLIMKIMVQIIFLMVFSFCAVAQTDTIAHGTTGNLSWVLTRDSTLTINGSGAMANYGTNDMPWYSNKNKIKSVVIGDEVTTIGKYAFYAFNGIESVKIGNSVTKIGEIAFYGCKDLVSINIPNSVRTIETAAFDGCGLTSVIIGNSVVEIWGYVFRNCTALASMIVNAIVPPTSFAPTNIIFEGVDATIPIYVPCNSLNAYKTSSAWSYFTNFVINVSTIPDIPAVTQNGNVLTSSSPTGNQWYINDTAILGATSQNHTCTQIGTYFVEVTNEYKCSSKSENINVTVLGIAGTNGIRSIQIYPNPTSGQLRVTSNELRENTVVEIFDIVGKCHLLLVTCNGIIDISHLSAGMYFLKIDGKVYKVIKQ